MLLRRKLENRSPISRLFGSWLFGALDLLELQFDRRRAAEDGHGYLHSAAIEVEFFDDSVKACEGTVEDLDRVADLVIDVDLGLGAMGGSFFFGVEHARGL